MEIDIAYNGDAKFITRLGYLTGVRQIHLKLSSDIMGGLCSQTPHKGIGLRELESAISEAHGQGLGVQYLLNAACQSNREYTRRHNDSLWGFVDSLVELGVDSFEISSPFMLGFLEANWPDKKAAISLFANVDNTEKAKYWAANGAERIVLSPRIYRDFKRLEKIRSSVDCELEIIANSGCLYSCPLERFHHQFVSHNTGLHNESATYPHDYYSALCSVKKLNLPAEMIKARWIRPEDSAAYRDCGVNMMRITGWQKSSEWLLNAAIAFQNEKYDGNLMDIINDNVFTSDVHTHSDALKSELIPIDNTGLRAEESALSQPDGSVKLYIDNKKLDGFMEFFRDVDCSKLHCGFECKYCHEKSNECLKYSQNEIKIILEKKKMLIDKVHNRSIFQPA